MKNNPIIIYVGDPRGAEALRGAVEARGWHLLLAREMLEALAMYAFYFPDLYVLEDSLGSTVAREVAYHLRSVGAEPLLILSDEPGNPEWDAAPGAAMRTLPRDIDPTRLLAEMAALLAGEPVAAMA